MKNKILTKELIEELDHNGIKIMECKSCGRIARWFPFSIDFVTSGGYYECGCGWKGFSKEDGEINLYNTCKELDELRYLITTTVIPIALLDDIKDKIKIIIDEVNMNKKLVGIFRDVYKERIK